ncbi:hypothetical protein MSAN_00255600 [Mycena sanguinolenta]|uniref:DUF1793-domain-containing protein n=1 Tax=Mycena sanguinolenta TaxID=230812 RepID=A0A8H6ZIA2_9AGAR|nr:hypothetical protein MSAN_00255600 [Mycena sanguinolenta]
MLSRHTLISLVILQLWTNWIASALAQQTFFPSAVPLAVRTPTSNCWLDTRNGSNPMTTWPTFWNDQHILGWAGYIKVDGLTYHWLGSPVPGNASTWIETQVTPTQTILTVQAGPMQLNVTFLSPIEPSDWGRQSFPFSYVYLDGTATDGKPHSVQLYSDISGEWVTNSFSTGIQWSTTKTSNTVFHQVGSTTPTSVFEDVAEDSVAYHAISSVSDACSISNASPSYNIVKGHPNLVSIVGTDQALRAQFATLGEGFTLTSDLAGQIGNVQGSDGKFPVLAHAMDLGNTTTITSIAWAVGVVRDPILTFSGGAAKGILLVAVCYHWRRNAFMVDFPTARTRALALDQKILQDARAISQNYADLVSLGARQAMAGVEITLSTFQNGSFDFSDVKAFMKDVGNSQRVNPVEVIYAALPAYMYLEPNITGALLEPLLEYQNSSSYTNPFAAPDLGGPFPAVPGDPTNLNAVYGIENSGNMLILVLAHARSTGDGSLIGKYYNLLKQWADYLVSNALIPGNQYSADARDGILVQSHANVTNLALKGIIGIQAMAEVSQIMGKGADAQNYTASATSLMQSWVGLASQSGRLRWMYDESTFGLMYNLLADKLLQLNLVPASIYTAESATLSSNQVQAQFGFSLSSDNASAARSDWTLFSAAAAPDNTTRDLLIAPVRNHASSNLTVGTFPTLYDVQTGLTQAAPNTFASPAQGAMFSVLALNVANQTIVVPGNLTTGGASAGSGGSKAKSHTGAIVGGVIAGIAALLLIGVVVIFLRRRARKEPSANDEFEAPTPTPYQYPMAQQSDGATFGSTNPGPSFLPDSPSSQPSRTFGSSVPSNKTTLISQNRFPPGPLSATSSQPASSHEPPSSGRRSSISRGTDELRSEMERLRQEVQELRANQDAPPGYQ